MPKSRAASSKKTLRNSLLRFSRGRMGTYFLRVNQPKVPGTGQSRTCSRWRLAQIKSAGEAISRIMRNGLSFLQVAYFQSRSSVNSVNFVTFFRIVGTIWAQFFAGGIYKKFIVPVTKILT